MNRWLSQDLSLLARNAACGLGLAILLMSAVWGCSDKSDDKTTTNDKIGTAGAGANVGRSVGKGGRSGTFRSSGAGTNAGTDTGGRSSQSNGGQNDTGSGGSGSGSDNYGNGDDGSESSVSTNPCANKAEGEWVCDQKILYLCDGQGDSQEKFACTSATKCKEAAQLRAKCDQGDQTDNGDQSNKGTCKAGQYKCSDHALTKCGQSGQWETDPAKLVKCADVCNEANRNCTSCKDTEKECDACAKCVFNNAGGDAGVIDNGTTSGPPAVEWEVYEINYMYIIKLDPAYRLEASVEWEPTVNPKWQLNIAEGDTPDEAGLKCPTPSLWYCSWFYNSPLDSCTDKSPFEWDAVHYLIFGGTAASTPRNCAETTSGIIQGEGEVVLGIGTACANPKLTIRTIKK